MVLADWIAIVGVGLTVLVVGLLILGWLLLSRQWHKARPEPQQTSTPPWIWIFLIMVVAMISYATAGKKPPGQPASPLIPPWVVFLLALGAFVVLVGILYAYAYLVNYDRDASRALKLALAGDKDGALFEMKNAMDSRKPSAVRSNALGLIHFLREEWPEAYKAFLDAQAIGGPQASNLANQGVVLLKLGRLDEAAAVLEEAQRKDPSNALMASNFGLALADLGRPDEAGAQREKARKNLNSTFFLNKAQRALYEQEIALLGERIEAARARLSVEEAS